MTMKNTIVLRSALFPLLCAIGLFSACSGKGEDGDGDRGDGGAANTSSSGDGDATTGLDLTAGTSDGTSGDGDSGTSTTGGQECGGEDVEAAPVETQMLLVVDTSESMDGTPSGFDSSKWETLVTSLKSALPKVEDRIGMGLKMFPSGDTDADVCSVETGIEVDIELGSDNVGSILSTVDAASRDGNSQGDTPTAVALSDALDYFSDGGGKDLSGNRFVLLATDGGPNCNDNPAVDCTCDADPTSDKDCGVRDKCTVNIDPDEVSSSCSLDGDWGSCCGSDQQTLCLDDAGTLDAVKALADAGIKTIVVGMPGSEAYTGVLDTLAEAGGVAAEGDTKYYKVEDPDGLTETLESITLNLIKTCEIEVAEPPADALEVNVYLDGEVIFKDDEDGWIYPGEEDDDFTVVELVGPTCEQVQKEGVEKISVKYGCDTIIR